MTPTGGIKDYLEVTTEGYKSLSTAELAYLADEVLRGAVVGSWMYEDDDDRMLIFPPLLLMNNLDIKKLRADGVVHVFEYREKAQSIAVNDDGLPMFYSFRSLNASDFACLMACLNRTYTGTDLTEVIKRMDMQMAKEDNPNPKVSGGRLLTPEEWAKVEPPFVSCKIDFSEWGELEYEIAVKWIIARATGWVYFSQKRFVFEKSDDYMLFKMWADNRPMVEGKDIEV